MFVALSILILVLGVCSGVFGQVLRFFVITILYCLGVFLLKHSPFQKKSTGILVYALPFLLLMIPTEIYSQLYKNYSGIPMFLGGVLGILFAIKLSNSSNKKIIYSLLIATFFIGIITYFLPNYYVYIKHKKNEIENTQLPNIVLYDETNKMVDLQSFKNKITVLDVWSSSCGVCIRDFPEFEKLKNEYKKDTAITFYSLNLPNKRDNRGFVSKFTSEYSFSKLYADNKVQEKLKIKSVPKCVIIDKNLKIRYIGFFNTGSTNLYYNFNSIIKTIKNDK